MTCLPLAESNASPTHQEESDAWRVPDRFRATCERGHCGNRVHATGLNWRAQTRVAPPYLRKSTTSGDLTLPKGLHEWAYVGPPPAPNTLNNGKASLPEFNNVYIEPGSYAVYQKVHVYRKGAIMFNEMQATHTGQQADGSRTEPSGRGHFPGAFNGADVSGGGTKRFADTRGWGFLDSNHYEPKPSTIHVTPAGECAYCPIASAKTA